MSKPHESAALYRGHCFCKAVNFTARAEPKRVGLCHCMDCRMRHGSVFKPFAVFDRGEVTVSGPLEEVVSRTGRRYACAQCHACMIWEDAGGTETELSLGHFDAPGVLSPEYEVWTIRREPWLRPLDVPQYERDRDKV